MLSFRANDHDDWPTWASLHIGRSGCCAMRCGVAARWRGPGCQAAERPLTRRREHWLVPTGGPAEDWKPTGPMRRSGVVLPPPGGDRPVLVATRSVADRISAVVVVALTPHRH